MTLRRRLLAALGGAALAAGVGLVGAAPAGAERSFSLPSLTTAATLDADGTMRVTETVTYRFTVDTGERPYTRATRTFDTPERIRDLRVTEAGRDLPVSRDGGTFAWTYGPQATGDRTFTVTYAVPGAVRVAPDVAELVWRFLGDDHPGVGRMEATVTLPGPAPPAPPGDLTDPSVLRAFAHGPSNGVITLRPDGARFEVAPVPARTSVEAVVVAPAALFPGVTPSGGPRLAEILDREQGFQDGDDEDGGRRLLGTVLGPLAALAGVAAVLVLWWRNGREPEVAEIGQYWREPLTDPPAIVYATLHHGAAGGTALSATAADLAQRGWLTIRETHEERIGPDKRGFAFERRAGGTGELGELDRVALSLLFPDGSPSSTTEAIQAWARANRAEGEVRWHEFQEAVRRAYEAKGYAVTGRGRLWLAYAAAVVAVVVLGIVAGLLGSVVGVLAAAAGVVAMVALGPLLRRRTGIGARRAAEAKALARYLKDFSHLDEAPVGHIVLWERFLVYAIALGVSAQLARGLAARLPALVADPGFAPWYVPVAGASLTDGFGAFDAGVGGTTAASMTPSSSGSGGGFSGGSAGGGGGGGFGAD